MWTKVKNGSEIQGIFYHKMLNSCITLQQGAFPNMLGLVPAHEHNKLNRVTIFRQFQSDYKAENKIYLYSKKFSVIISLVIYLHLSDT